MATQWSDQLLIRRALPEDIQEIYSLEQQEASSWSIPLIKAEIVYDRGVSLIARDTGNKVVGWCSARFLPPEAELLKISVLPGLRRRNIGSRLLRRVIDICRNKQCNILLLEVAKRNMSARAFYAHFDFTREATRKNYYSQPQDDCLILRLDV